MSFVDSTLAIGSAALGVGLLRASWSRRGGGRPWLTTAGWLAFFGGAVAWHGAGLGWDEAIALAMLGPCLIAYGVLARQAGWSTVAASVTRAGRPGASQGAAKRSLSRSVANSESAEPNSLGERNSPALRNRGATQGQPSAMSGRLATAVQSTGSGMRLPASPEPAELHAPEKTRPSAAAESAPPASLARGAARVLLAGPLALVAALGLTALIALRTPWLEADRLVTAGFLLPIAWAAGAIWATMDGKLVRVAVALSLTAIVCVGGAVV